MTETTTVQPDFEPVEIRFDKPFALVLRDTKTDAVMFAGIVNDPTSK
jgi:serine protease inhibitor